MSHTNGPWMKEGLFVYALAPDPVAPHNKVNRFSVNINYDNRSIFPGIEPELDANAGLIAAAPDLLAACNLALAALANPQAFDIEQVGRNINKAIQKAEGGAQ